LKSHLENISINNCFYPVIVNRCALRVEANKEFIDWINANNLNKIERMESVIYLFEDTETENKFNEWLEENYKSVVNSMLTNYCENSCNWPSIVNRELFFSWFKINFSDLIIDLGSEEIKIV
jgi:hypothetical protein